MNEGLEVIGRGLEEEKDKNMRRKRRCIPLKPVLAREIAHDSALAAADVAVLPAVVGLQEPRPTLIAITLQLGLDEAETIVAENFQDMQSAFVLVIWSLDIGAYLEFGAWDL